jgi:hypothetical protein
MNASQLPFFFGATDFLEIFPMAALAVWLLK